MASPFLLSFTQALLARLEAAGHVEIVGGDAVGVARFVALRLGGAGQGESLVSSVVAALIACPEVVELYADDETIKDMITDLPNTVLRGAS